MLYQLSYPGVGALYRRRYWGCLGVGAAKRRALNGGCQSALFPTLTPTEKCRADDKSTATPAPTARIFLEEALDRPVRHLLC